MATAQRKDTWRPWVWASFLLNAIIATVFAILCWYTWREFKRVASTPSARLPPSIILRDWLRLFDGAAASASFAVMLVILFVVFSVIFMLFTRHNLSHPQNRFGKGFMIACTFYTALHICNIAIQFLSFHTPMSTWNTKYGTSFNTVLLDATYFFGFASTVCFFSFSFVLAFWKYKDVLSEQLNEPLAA